MSTGTPTNFSPSGPGAQSLGTETLLWGPLHTQGISTPDGLITPADLVETQKNVSALEDKGGVSDSLSIYIREGGRPDNDGLSETTALDKPSSAIALVNNKYKGLADRLVFDTGGGTYVDDWSPYDLDVSPRSLSIVGNSIDSTIFINSRTWAADTSGARYNGDNIAVQRFTLGSTGSEVVAAMDFSYTSNIVIGDVRIDNTSATSSPIAFRFGTGVAAVNIVGPCNFKGTQNSIVRALNNYDLKVYVGAPFIFESGASFAASSSIFYCVYGTRIFVAGVLPTYNTAVPTYFSTLQWNSEIMFNNSSTQASWINGWNSSIDGSSRIRARQDS